MDETADTTVADAMVTAPKICTAETTVAAMHQLFADDHVHVALIVRAGVLLAVVERSDLRADLAADGLAAQAGRLDGRTVSPGRPLHEIGQVMVRARRRRLAVVDDDGALLGLLCLKRHGRGFCSNADVLARRRPIPLSPPVITAARPARSC